MPRGPLIAFPAVLDDVEAMVEFKPVATEPGPKTQVLRLGSKFQLLKVDIQDVPVLKTSVKIVDTARDLGLVIDSGLTMSYHVTAVCPSAYYQLRQLCTIARSLSDNAAKTLVQAFISCRLDYGNALLCGISDDLVQCLQSVQNAAARLVTGAGRREHITPVLRQLHWLPVRQRIDIKVMVLVYKSLHRLAPPYLSDDCQLVTDVGRRHLRSADVHTCTIPQHSQGSAIEVLGSPDHGCGTACPLNCDSKT